jgi:hypothetical protein
MQKNIQDVAIYRFYVKMQYISLKNVYIFAYVEKSINFGLRLALYLFSVGLVSPTAFPFEAKTQLASSPARNYVRTFVQTTIFLAQ